MAGLTHVSQNINNARILSFEEIQHSKNTHTVHRVHKHTHTKQKADYRFKENPAYVKKKTNCHHRISVLHEVNA